MTSMVERVARAIKEETAYWLPGDTHDKLYERAARAAIEAMREPTETMVAAAGDTAHHEDDTLPFKVVFDKYWQAAIGTALSEQISG